MKISAIIEARMESSRLWGKVMLPINGTPILQLLINRIRLSYYIDEIILAVPDSPYSIIIEENINHVDYIYKGSMDDVFSRVLNAAQTRKTDIIINITGDCPLVDHRHIDYLVEQLINKEKASDTVSCFLNNYSPRSWPDGFDVSVFTTKGFRWLDKLTKDGSYSYLYPHSRSHTSWNFTRFPSQFISINLLAPPKYNLPHIGLTLDTPEDYLLLTKIYKHFNNTYTSSKGTFDMTAEKIIDYVLANKNLLEINNSITRKTPGEG